MRTRSSHYSRLLLRVWNINKEFRQIQFLIRGNSIPLRLIPYHTQVRTTVIPTQKSVCMGTECPGFAQRYQAPLSKRSSLVVVVRTALYTCRLPALPLTRHMCPSGLPNRSHVLRTRHFEFESCHENCWYFTRYFWRTYDEKQWKLLQTAVPLTSYVSSQRSYLLCRLR